MNVAQRRRLWIDTDTASDDAVAMVMAFKNPGVEVVGVGPLARAYGGRWVSTAAEAAEALAALVEPGDVILVKGSRSVGLEVVAAKLTGQ